MANITVDKIRRRWILAGLMATMMLAAMDTTIVATAIPQIVGDLGGFSLFTWVFSIYLLAQTVTIPIYGKLADTYGRKPILFYGALIFLAGSGASALSWNMVALIVFRSLQGLGAGAIMATVNTLAGDLYSVRERAVIQGFLSSVWGVSAIAGPTLGGAFAEYASWRWIFLVNLPVGAVALTLIGTLLKEQIERQNHKLDFAGAGGVLISIGIFIFALLQGGQSWNWISIPSIVLFAGAIIIFTITIFIERRAQEPIMPSWLWRHRFLAFSNLAMVCMGIAMMAPDTYLPTFGQAVLGLGAIAAGLVLASMSIGWPTSSALSGQLYLRIGFRNTALIGTVCLTTGAIGFLFIGYPGNVWMLVLDQILIGAGCGLTSTPVLVGVQSSVDWHKRGVVTGANMFCRYLGQSLGAAIFGAIFNATISAHLSGASGNVKSKISGDMNDILHVLNSADTSSKVESFLRHSVFNATWNMYLGMALVAFIAFLAVICMPNDKPNAAKKLI